MCTISCCLLLICPPCVGQCDRVLELHCSTRQSAFAPAAVCQPCSGVGWGDLSVDFVLAHVRVCYWPEGDWNQVTATPLRYVSRKLLPCLLPCHAATDVRATLAPTFHKRPKVFLRRSTFISTNFILYQPGTLTWTFVFQKLGRWLNVSSNHLPSFCQWF